MSVGPHASWVPRLVAYPNSYSISHYLPDICQNSSILWLFLTRLKLHTDCSSSWFPFRSSRLKKLGTLVLHFKWRMVTPLVLYAHGHKQRTSGSWDFTSLFHCFHFFSLSCSSLSLFSSLCNSCTQRQNVKMILPSPQRKAICISVNLTLKLSSLLWQKLYLVFLWSIKNTKNLLYKAEVKPNSLPPSLFFRRNQKGYSGPQGSMPAFLSSFYLTSLLLWFLICTLFFSSLLFLFYLFLFKKQ